MGAPATSEKERERKLENRMIVITSGSAGTLAVNCSGQVPLRREQWERLEIGHRRRDQATRLHKQNPQKGRNSDTLLGYLG
jgi:hypothetical protein